MYLILYVECVPAQVLAAGLQRRLCGQRNRSSCPAPDGERASRWQGMGRVWLLARV